MKVKDRFLKSVIATAATTDVHMPWTRGKTRTAMILRRSAPVLKAVKTA
ncbi:hypothetical protein [Thalassococcus sp. S3]|nr:hypothetical protein [Thalassococcus sp. S3]